MPHRVHGAVHRFLGAGDCFVDGLPGCVQGLLDRLLGRVHGFAGRLGHAVNGRSDAFHGAQDLLFQAFELLGQGLARLPHLLLDYFRFVIHATFSFRAASDCSGTALTVSSFLRPR